MEAGDCGDVMGMKAELLQVDADSWSNEPLAAADAVVGGNGVVNGGVTRVGGSGMPKVVKKAKGRTHHSQPFPTGRPRPSMA